MVPIIAAMLLLAAAPDSADRSSAPAIVLRVQQDSARPLSTASLRRVEAQVRAIWSAYADIRLSPFNAAPIGRVDDVLTVVITDARSATSAGDSLGWITFVDDDPLPLMTVSRTEAERLGARTVWGGRAMKDWPHRLVDQFVERTIARTIAHEIGHYLLRSKSHAAHGLMQAQFNGRDVMNPTEKATAFEPEAIAVLQSRFNDYRVARREPPQLPNP